MRSHSVTVSRGLPLVAHCMNRYGTRHSGDRLRLAADTEVHVQPMGAASRLGKSRASAELGFVCGA